MKDMGKILIVDFVALVFCLSIVGGISYVSHPYNERKVELKKQVSLEADKNWDRFTSPEEWAKVYQEVRPGTRYDSKYPPKKLTNTEMEFYLQNNARP